MPANGPNSLGIRQGGIGGIAEDDIEHFAGIGHRVADDGDRDGQARLAGIEREGAAGGVIIVAGNGAAVGGGKVDRDGLRTGGTQADREHELSRSSAAAGLTYVIDGDGWRGDEGKVV